MAQTANPFTPAGAPSTADDQPHRATSPEAFTVSDIRIDGLQRISAGTVFTYLPIERGDTDRPDREAEGDPRAVQDRVLQRRANSSRQGNILVVTVGERPAINKLTLEGNKDIKTEDLQKGLKDIGLAEGETFDRLEPGPRHAGTDAPVQQPRQVQRRDRCRR